MLKPKVQDALNDQLNFEFYSSYIYLAMAADFESKNLDGFANWMKVQAQEEWIHGMKFYTYINEQGGKVKLDAIKAPQAAWDSPQAVFEDALAHEQEVTMRIGTLIDLANKEHDHASNIFLQWFVTEQTEEENNVGKVIDQLKMIGNNPQGLFMMDQSLGQRPAPAPDPAAAE